MAETMTLTEMPVIGTEEQRGYFERVAKKDPCARSLSDFFLKAGYRRAKELGFDIPRTMIPNLR